MRWSRPDRNKGKNAMNKKTESKGAPDVLPLRDNELDAIAGGTGLATMVTQAVGQAVTQAANQLVKT
jgi:hypothetical protein